LFPSFFIFFFYSFDFFSFLLFFSLFLFHSSSSRFFFSSFDFFSSFSSFLSSSSKKKKSRKKIWIFTIYYRSLAQGSVVMMLLPLATPPHVKKANKPQLSLAARNKEKKNKKKQRRWLPGWDRTLPTTITSVIVCMKDLVTFFFSSLFGCACSLLVLDISITPSFSFSSPFFPLVAHLIAWIKVSVNFLHCSHLYVIVFFPGHFF